MANSSRIIVEGLRALISIPEASSAESLGKRVKSNVALYKKFLNGPPFVDLVAKLERKKATLLSVDELKLNTELLCYHHFCSEAIALFSELENSMSQLSPACDDLSQTKSQLTPAALLSVAEQKVVKNAMEFLVCLGIYPHLIPGADGMLKLRLKRAEEVVKAVDVNRLIRDRHLYEICEVISRCFNNNEMGPILAMRHLSDILVALIQVIYAPDKVCVQVTTDETLGSDLSRACGITGPGDVGLEQLGGGDKSVRGKSVTLLEQVLKQTYQPLVIQQLLMLQGPPSSSAKKSGGSPSWLIKACGRYLSERLMTKNGVVHVINGIMEATSGADHAMSQGAVWRKCKAVATILATPPSTVSSLDHYYSAIPPQILSVLHSHKVSEEHTRIVTQTISLMLKKTKRLADSHLLYPLVLPLNKLVNDPFSDDPMDTMVQNVQECIYILHKMSELSEPSSEFLSSLLPYAFVLFELWRMLPDSHHMSTHCREILGRVLSSVSNADVLHFLCCVSRLPHKSSEYKKLDSSLSISFSGTPPRLTISRLTGPPDLELMESTGKLVVELLQTTLETRSLTKIFFVKCMESLMSIISKDVNLPCNTGTSSCELLECEQVIPKSQTEYVFDSQILYITSALCENLSDVILKDLDISDLLETFKTIFECHAKSVSTVQLIPSKKTNCGEITGGPVSLSICCGLVSALLSGNKTIRVVDRPVLMSLQPSLDKIAACYPDSELRIVAGDIRICIGTLGAVWSAEIEKVADFRSVTKNLTSHIRDKVSPNQQSKIENNDYSQHTNNSSSSPYHNAVQDLKDALIAVRGHGLIMLTKLIYEKDKETLSNVPFLMDQFQQNLGHSDSYIYLAAINAFVSLALSTPQDCSEKVLTTLCQEYANLSDRPHRSFERVFDEDTGQLKANLTTPSPNHGIETRMKVGEALVKIFCELSDMLPHYCEDIIASLLTTVKDREPLLRASSLSNIAEICKLNRRVVDLFLTEVLSCVDHVLRSDQEVCVRQAALVVLKNMITGASPANITERSDTFLEIYRLLKRVEAAEHDELTKIHAQSALGELDAAMRTFIFTSERKLEKKITVLS